MTIAAQPTPRTALLRRKLEYVRGHAFGARATRFRLRATGKAESGKAEADFAMLAAMPEWMLADEERQALVGLAAAILQARPAIDRELSGVRLAAIAAVVGDALFDRLCDCDLHAIGDMSVTARLPRPEDLPAIGAQLRLAALPASLCDGRPIEDGEATRARLLCAIAAKAIEAGTGEP
ncbi:MAG: hypothetical protein ACRCY3_03905 [Sphingorhabdus sp.]